MALVTNGLIHFLRFDNGANGIGSGQTVTNYGSNTQTAQVGSTTGADTNDPTWDAVGQLFLGDDYDLLTGGISGLSFATGSYTQIFLARWDTTAGGTATKRPLIAHSAGGDRAGTMQMGGGQLHCIIGNQNLYSGTSEVVAGDWYVVHTIRNGSYGEVGKNTALVMSTNNVSNGTQGASYRIGGSGFGQYLTGAIAAHLVYNRALTADELLEVYNYLYTDIATPRGIVLPDMGGVPEPVDVEGAVHTHTAERAGVLVSPAGSAHAHAAEVAAVLGSPATSTHAHTAERAAVLVTPANDAHSQIAEAALVTALAAESVHPHTAEPAETVITAAEASHTHSAEAAAVEVAAADTVHPHGAELVSVVADAEASSSAHVAEVAAVAVAVADSTHAHASETAETVDEAASVTPSTHAHLSERARVEASVRDSPHAHMSETVAVSVAAVNTGHAHEAQVAGISISVASDVHAHTADPAAVSVAVQDSVHPHLSATVALAGAVLGYVTRPEIRDASVVRTVIDASSIRTIAGASRTRAVRDSSRTRSIRDA